MSGITPEVRAILTRPFEVDEHELRDGGRDGKLVYITEEPLIARLTEADPNWGFVIISNERTDYGGRQADFVVVHAALTICGVTRHNVGFNGAAMKTFEYVGGQRKDLAEPIPYPLTHTEIKGGPTDSLKRCARLFEVGAYLLRLKGVTIRNMQDFANWHARTFNADQPARSTPRQSAPAQPRASKPASKASAEAEPPAYDLLTDPREFEPDMWAGGMCKAFVDAKLADNMHHASKRLRLVYELDHDAPYEYVIEAQKEARYTVAVLAQMFKSRQNMRDVEAKAAESEG